LNLVHTWLSEERNGEWLMIIDNADDDRVFIPASFPVGNDAQESDSAAPSLARYVPQTPNGRVLVTSRDLRVALNLVGSTNNITQVDAMTEGDALTLLKSRIPVDELSERDASLLIQSLEGIPLAVTHAAAYIAVKLPDFSISEYLKLFYESEENQSYLLNIQEAKDMRRDPSGSHAVITTWQMSFELIRETNPKAADVLSLMAMYDRQGIPDFLLDHDLSRLQSREPPYEELYKFPLSKLDFTEAITPLIRFSLIKKQATVQSGQSEVKLFTMHSLVQLATKTWLRVHEETEK
jgi:hypothetical protein